MARYASVLLAALAIAMLVVPSAEAQRRGGFGGHRFAGHSGFDRDRGFDFGRDHDFRRDRFFFGGGFFGGFYPYAYAPAYAPYYPYYYPPPAYAPAAAVVPPPIASGTAGANCREFATTVVIDGRRERAVGTACRQADGSWRVSR